MFTGIRSSTASSFPISRACSSQAGQFHQVPTIVGFTRDEGAGFIPRTFPAGVTLAQYEAWVADEFGADGPAVLGMYPAADYPLPGDAMARVLGDGQFVCEGRRFARASERRSDTRVLLFV